MNPAELFIDALLIILSLECASLAAKVVHLKKDAGHTFSFEELKEAVEKHKPTALFLCQASPP